MPGLRLRRRLFVAVAAIIAVVAATALFGLLGAPGLGQRAADGTARTTAGATEPAATDGSGHNASGQDPLSASSAHSGLAEGRTTVDPAVNGFDPSLMVRDFDWGTTRTLADGRVLREWTIVSSDKEIEVAPGVKFAAWTFNGRVPGPTLRAREGELLRIHFTNGSSHPHTMHFHGIHRAAVDGIPGEGEEEGGGLIQPGESFTYEFDAAPFGIHAYHCHASPLAQHIHKGLYGAFIIDPKPERPKADELVMVMNGFDTNFDGSNEVYAVNSVAFHYLYHPIQVKRGELVRIYLLNMLEFDQVNSFHLHANFFDYYPTGTRLEPSEYTDIIIQAQAQRGILEVRFPYTGRYMFHAHTSEFAELGWMGFFEVTE